MHILLVLHHYLDPNQGAPGATLALGAAMETLGCQVDYFGFDQAFPGNSGVGVGGGLQFPWLLARHLTRHAKDFDVVDVSTGDGWVWAGRGRPGAKSRHLLVTRSHGLEHAMDAQIRLGAKQSGVRLSWKYPLYHGGFRLWEVARSLRCADLALLLNQHDRDFAGNTLHVDPAKLRVVRNGIHESLLNLPFERFPDPQAPMQIAQVGSYIPRKGTQYGGPALNTVLARHPRVSVTFLGAGCPPEQVQADFAPALRDRVRVIPRYAREQLPRLLRGHQVMLFPSLSEGFGLGLLEAMACGLVPVSSNVPGPTEFVCDGQNGILVPPRDSEAIEQALERLIVDAPLRERLRCQAHVTAQNYGWKEIAQETLALYEDGLRRKPA